MLKHGILIPTLFLTFALVFGFYNHEAISKEYGTKTNIFHDAIGGKILADNDVDFEKIVVTRGKDVLFCDTSEALFLFIEKEKKVVLKKKKSPKCGKVLTEDGVKRDNGAGKLFSSLFKAIKKDEKNAQTEESAESEKESQEKK